MGVRTLVVSLNTHHKMSAKVCKQQFAMKGVKTLKCKSYKFNSKPSDILPKSTRLDLSRFSRFTRILLITNLDSRVYKHITGQALEAHAVKLIGWGTSEEGEDYWVVTNLWNRDLGPILQGKRGTNQCGTEAGVVASLPSSKKLVKETVDADFTYLSAFFHCYSRYTKNDMQN